MKRFVIALTALSLLAPAVASAAPRHDDHKPPHAMQKPMMTKKKVVTHRWTRGHKLPAQYRGKTVDYRHYHLRAPGRGQHWVRVGNEYLLVGVATGVIAAVVAAQ